MAQNTDTLSDVPNSLMTAQCCRDICHDGRDIPHDNLTLSKLTEQLGEHYLATQKYTHTHIHDLSIWLKQYTPYPIRIKHLYENQASPWQYGDLGNYRVTYDFCNEAYREQQHIE